MVGEFMEGYFNKITKPFGSNKHLIESHILRVSSINRKNKEHLKTIFIKLTSLFTRKLPRASSQLAFSYGSSKTVLNSEFPVLYSRLIINGISCPNARLVLKSSIKLP